MFDQNEFKKYATKHVGINSLTYDSYVSAITPGIRNLTPNIIEERQLNVSVSGCILTFNDGSYYFLRNWY
jgi:ATP-dependent Clp protease protease subunit